MRNLRLASATAALLALPLAARAQEPAVDRVSEVSAFLTSAIVSSNRSVDSSIGMQKPSNSLGR